MHFNIKNLLYKVLGSFYIYKMMKIQVFFNFWYYEHFVPNNKVYTKQNTFTTFFGLISVND